ncbi:MAG: MBL fold metallo-hydrolase [Chloroflexi bacterium]|nr:MBL fold metallo-hydrolase [Chloroflexota bacterium]
MMQVTFWGTRGSIPTPDPEMTQFGGNSSCVEVQGGDGSVLVLDAGTGIRRLGRKLAGRAARIDVLLTHLHMDHIQGLGFFAPLYQPGLEVHVWGPPSTTETLGQRLARYLSPPLFPVHLREVPSRLQLHDLTGDDIRVGRFHIQVAYVCHPNPTVGYRIADGQSVVTYLPDHEPVLGAASLDRRPAWISGYALAAGAELLIHDAQYSSDEYPDHVGWGHSSMKQAFEFADLTGAAMLAPFHHDPSHTDDDIERMVGDALRELRPRFAVVPAMEGGSFVLDGRAIHPEHRSEARR